MYSGTDREEVNNEMSERPALEDMELGTTQEATENEPSDTKKEAECPGESLIGLEAPALVTSPSSQQEIPASHGPRSESSDVTDDVSSLNGDPGSANGNTPLHCACQTFAVKEVARLLEEGTSVDRTNRKDQSPLHEMIQSYLSFSIFDQAAHFKKLMDIMVMLIKAGLDVTQGDARQQTPLHYVTAHAEQGDVIRALFSSGVRINLEDRYGQTALHLAVATGNMSNVQALMEGGADPNYRNRSGQTPLHLAAKGKHHDGILILLLRCGGNANVVDRGFQTALHIAAKNGRTILVRILLDGGAIVDAVDSSGQTPLHLAAAHDITGTVCGVLLTSGANKNIVDYIYCETPLHKAVRMRMVHNVQMLLKFRARPDIKDVSGETAYHKATSVEELVVWKHLMANKRSACAMKVQNHSGLTPFQKALKAKNHVALAMMKQYGVQDF